MKDGRTLGGRSACMACQKKIAPFDLIPIFSWVLLRGVCRQCRVPIHLQYPAVEVAGALIGAFAIWRGDDVAFTAALLFFLLVIAVFDLRWQLVPMAFTLAGAGVLGLWHAAALQSFALPLLGAFAVGGFLGIFVWGSQGRWMGEGDPVVGAAIGAALGWPLAPLALLLSFVVGGAVSSLLLLFGVVTRKTPVPFVPFLALGATIVYAWEGASRLFLFYAFG